MGAETGHTPIKVAIIGGGCASTAAAFELTRPEHQGKYQVTIYQLGWRLGGKGASGRGPAGRIEEHGLHVWQGYYENAFRLIRECYHELNRDPGQCRIADWTEAFEPARHVGLAESSGPTDWQYWMAHFPPIAGLPGDPLASGNPFSMSAYLGRCATLLSTILASVKTNVTPDGLGQTAHSAQSSLKGQGQWDNPKDVLAELNRLLVYGQMATIAGLLTAIDLLTAIFGNLPRYPDNVILRFLEVLGTNIKDQLEKIVAQDDGARRVWEIVDLLLAVLRGAVRFGLATDPRGFDVINDYDCREWLRLNGASGRTLDSAFVRGIYDISFAYEDGDFENPRLAAGLALRGAFRMFFTYRGSLFWKMRSGMGDVVFAPLYEVLKKRGVSFQFFHRLENVKLVESSELRVDERPYVTALEFSEQAKIKDGQEYEPLIDVQGLPCWPSTPLYAQLVDGEQYEGEARDFESHWDDRKVASRTLHVGEDFDFVVLGVGVGAIPYVCRELIARDPQWQTMVDHVKTTATQAFQVWLKQDLETLGWNDPPTTMASFVQPFDSWADMRQLISEEQWPLPPRAIVYLCSVLPDHEAQADPQSPDYPRQRQDEVRQNAIRFLKSASRHLWPQAAMSADEFRWELLCDPEETEPVEQTSADESRFATQFWSANVNPSDRYTLPLPGTLAARISPLDNSYDNLTIAGDWTNCGINMGCVEAAVMSGRLAAHAIAQSPALEDIIGYDHP